jgi:hypothetical protein
MTKKANLVTTHQQLNLDLQIIAEREIEGVHMGVLSDSTPFLSIRGLAKMCGVSHQTIIAMTEGWQNEPLKPRERRVRELIREEDGDDTIAFIATIRSGTIYHAIPSAVCMAVLEYYAFEAKHDNREKALHSYRTLARKGFTDFVYAQVGFNPAGSIDIAWQQFQDRVLLTYHNVPDGYFSVFKEMADLIVTLIRGKAQVGISFVPDQSVGQHWSKFWAAENLDVVYGERRRYEHNYPDYFPQAASNPQPAFCYPDDALGEFRKWLKQEYVTKKMPVYLQQKTKQGQISAATASAAIEAFAPRSIADKREG